MRKLALTGVALLLALVGCSSSSPVASVTPTDDTGRYLVLARVAFGLPATESGADADLLATGKSTCAGFSKGMDWDAVNEIAVMDGGRTADQAKLLIAAAVKGLCPQYSDRLPS